MLKLIEKAIEQEYHLMIGAIDAANSASIALHEKLGFDHAGTIKQAGLKFGRWLDLASYQLILNTPHDPVDGGQGQAIRPMQKAALVRTSLPLGLCWRR